MFTWLATGHVQFGQQGRVPSGRLPHEEIELRTLGNGQYYGRFMLQPSPGSGPSCRRAWSP